jgi:hypothetical protein
MLRVDEKKRSMGLPAAVHARVLCQDLSSTIDFTAVERSPVDLFSSSPPLSNEGLQNSTSSRLTSSGRQGKWFSRRSSTPSTNPDNGPASMPGNKEMNPFAEVAAAAEAAAASSPLPSLLRPEAEVLGDRATAGNGAEPREQLSLSSADGDNRAVLGIHRWETEPFPPKQTTERGHSPDSPHEIGPIAQKEVEFRGSGLKSRRPHHPQRYIEDNQNYVDCNNGDGHVQLSTSTIPRRAFGLSETEEKVEAAPLSLSPSLSPSLIAPRVFEQLPAELNPSFQTSTENRYSPETAPREQGIGLVVSSPLFQVHEVQENLSRVQRR